MKSKIITSIISLVFLGLAIYIIFFAFEINSNPLSYLVCVILVIWFTFIPQSSVYYYNRIKNADLNSSKVDGYKNGIKDLLFFIATPYYGIKFYFTNSNKM